MLEIPRLIPPPSSLVPFVHPGVCLGSYRCLVSLPGLRRILRAGVLIVCLGVAVLAPEINAQSPAPHPQAPGSAVQTFTPSDLASIDDPWPFQAGDDPHFADPALDDSSWPSIRPNRPFQTIWVARCTAI